MKISFVIPAYNEQEYIGHCLRSIMDEARRAPGQVEIIVVNNASTDQTALVASSFPNVRVVNEPRKGLSRARQAGFSAATGELIANVDADTRLPPGWLETVCETFNRQPEIIALSGPMLYYDISRGAAILQKIFYRLAFISYLFNRFVLRVGSFLQGGNFVVRRRALEAIGGYNQSFDFYGEDADLARRLHKLGPVIFTFKLPIYGSGRRLIAEGKFTMAWRYAVNYFWTIFFKKPFTKKFVDIRTVKNHAD